MPLRLGIDCDGVLADFNRAFIELCVDVTGRDLFGYGYVPTTWNYPESVGYTREEVSRVWDVIKYSDLFWEDLPDYSTTEATIDTLLTFSELEGDDIYFITNRMGVQPKAQSEAWLRWQGFPYPTVLLSAEKGLCAKALSLDAYLDDKYENALDVAHTHTRSFLLNRPWNAGCNTEGWNITRVDTPMEFLQYCEGMRHVG